MTKQDRINEVTTLVRDIDATGAKLAELEQRLDRLVNPTAKAAPVKKVTTGTVKAQRATTFTDDVKASLLALLRTSAGERLNVTALAKHTGFEPKDISAVIGKLDGIQTEGKKRAKVYWLEPENTDGERLEAAE